MKLYMDYEWLSPYTFTVQAALLEKQIPFEVREVRFAKGESLDPEFTGLTPTDLIPALADGGQVFSESLAILEYLEDKHPETSLWPADIAERARARMLVSWYRCGFKALREERSTETIFYASERAKLKPLSAAAREEVREWMIALEPCLKQGGEFLFGRWSIADSETALMAHRLIANGDAVDPRLLEFAKRIWARPSSRAFAERKRPDFQSYYV